MEAVTDPEMTAIEERQLNQKLTGPFLRDAIFKKMRQLGPMSWNDAKDKLQDAGLEVGERIYVFYRRRLFPGKDFLDVPEEPKDTRSPGAVEDDDIPEPEEDELPDPPPEPVTPSVKRGPGRPRKVHPGAAAEQACYDKILRPESAREEVYIPPPVVPAEKPPEDVYIPPPVVPSKELAIVEPEPLKEYVGKHGEIYTVTIVKHAPETVAVLDLIDLIKTLAEEVGGFTVLRELVDFIGDPK